MVFSQPTLRIGDLGPIYDAPRLCGSGHSQLLVAFPQRLRHVAFQGHLLHGVPGSLEGQQGERLALLVNLWCHHRPEGLRSYGGGLQKRRCASFGRRKRVPAFTSFIDVLIHLHL